MEQIKFRSAHYSYDGLFKGFSYWGFIDRFDIPTKDTFCSPTSRSGTERKFEEMWTGLNDKNGTPIYEGDVIRYMEPIRTTQTHTGDNIPNGSYTEPMEPGIKTHEGEIKFHEGSFIFDDFETNDDHFPISWCFTEWDEEGIREAISYGRDPARWPWDDPEEGDLQFLLEENNLTTAEELCKYLSGVEVIGNIHDEEYSN